MYMILNTIKNKKGQYNIIYSYKNLKITMKYHYLLNFEDFFQNYSKIVYFKQYNFVLVYRNRTIAKTPACIW